MTQQSPPQPIQKPLTLVMTAKSSQDHAALQQIIQEMQSLPPEKNPITTALNNLANVHFARFVFLNNNQLAVITTYDGDFVSYINDFINEIGDVFQIVAAIGERVKSARILRASGYLQAAGPSQIQRTLPPTCR